MLPRNNRYDTGSRDLLCLRRIPHKPNEPRLRDRTMPVVLFTEIPAVIAMPAAQPEFMALILLCTAAEAETI